LASERPDLVARAVLAEPVLFEKPDGPELGWRNPFIDRTLKRKRVFDSVDAMFRNFENKPPYSGWRKDMLRDYCEYGTQPAADGKRELKCAPEIEARFYETSRDFDGLSRILACNVPLLAMLGQRGDSLGAVFSERLSKDLKSGRVINFPEAGHFLPMEFPDQVSEKAVEFLSAQSV
jgi:pimeloyl-ACP methyl ester carboxylesterase